MSQHLITGLRDCKQVRLCVLCNANWHMVCIGVLHDSASPVKLRCAYLQETASRNFINKLLEKEELNGCIERTLLDNLQIPREDHRESTIPKGRGKRK